MTPLLWQALLTAELPAIKGRVLLKELGPCVDEGLDRLLQSSRLSPTERKRLANLNSAAVEEAVKRGVRIVSYGEYSEHLRNWPDNPLGLFVAGDWSVTKLPSVAIVGTRGATTYGKAVATKFAESFARAGVTVVSGGALGIDAAAHKGVINEGGKTVAVMASGIDRVYPAVNQGLFKQIREEHGCLVSQFACGTKPDFFRFIMRNHVIAAMSQAVVVIEAPERSGAISTANRANELGRQVFVVPANIENQNFRGSHALIRDGATLVDHPDQVLLAMGLDPSAATKPLAPLNGVAAEIVKVLTTAPLAIEFILERTGLDMPEVMSELTMLEMDGRIIHDAGGYAVKP